METVKPIESILNETRSEFLQSDTRRATSIQAHLKIIDALERGDPEMALQGMREHLVAVGKAIFGEQERGSGQWSMISGKWRVLGGEW